MSVNSTNHPNLMLRIRYRAIDVDLDSSTHPTHLAETTNWPGGLVMAWEDCVILSISHSENEYEPGSRTQTIHLVL